MKRTGIYTIGALVATAAVAFAIQSGATLLQGHSGALAKADGLSTRLVAVSAGGGRLQTTVDMAKPNFLRIDGPTTLTISDGKDLYTLYKGQNAFVKKAVSAEALAAAMSGDQFLALRPFFMANALNGMTSVKTAAAVNRKGMEMTPVSGNLGGKRATLYISAADSIARQVELTETGDGKTESLIIDMLDMTLARPAASKFTFKAPAGSREMDEAEMTAVKWYYTMDEAKADAARTNRPIMMDLYTDWCHFCKKLDAEVFSTAEFKAKARSFVLLKINPEKDPGQNQGFEVEGFPTVIFMTKGGQEIHRSVGFRPTDLFLAEMDKALSNNR